ncbi:sigma-70 family RNA polymerase sigma factor [Nocardioides lianchengensis]|uniref:RNA polymerase sigma-B factor n=1 Tax=Nocardioides lianchengensis TaxID=1045774 RepID=A0A1G6WT29_9ACTN|nr:sigma-70 family RNA polymerase sigma factor [Nocardioides lianchengensis]NYG09210.1 RNA polymerase sigma-B factor [Nocardioides lianchengensis]SDD68939.1 RNA polymerase sigma-B factor [Nocardioides lianchengensis]
MTASTVTNDATTDRRRSEARATGSRDGDRGLTRQQRSERTAELLDLACDADETTRRELLDEVVLINRGVAEAVASRYRNRGIAQDDLVQVAYEGLTKAVLRFDPRLRNDLLTYAVPTIRGELQRYFRDQGWTVRPPRRVQELQWRVNHALEDLGQRLGREPTDVEVMDHLDIDVDEYREAIEAFGCFQPTSLDLPIGQESPTTLGALIPDDDHDRDAADARVALAPVVRRLSERDRRILYLRFFEDRTQEEIGADLGVTQMQVSRLLSRILQNMRDEVG